MIDREISHILQQLSRVLPAEIGNWYSFSYSFSSFFLHNAGRFGLVFFLVIHDTKGRLPGNNKKKTLRILIIFRLCMGYSIYECSEMSLGLKKCSEPVKNCECCLGRRKEQKKFRVFFPLLPFFIILMDSSALTHFNLQSSRLVVDTPSEAREENNFERLPGSSCVTTTISHRRVEYKRQRNI